MLLILRIIFASLPFVLGKQRRAIPAARRILRSPSAARLPLETGYDFS
jgi:hypothetical protein